MSGNYLMNAHGSGIKNYAIVCVKGMSAGAIVCVNIARSMRYFS